MNQRINDRGASIVEIVVAVFLLAIFAIALLPMLATSLKITTANTNDSVAVQFANGQLEKVRAAALSSNCATFQTAILQGLQPLPVESSPGRTLSLSQSLVGSCADNLAEVRFQVQRDDDPAPVVDFTAKILVGTP